MSRSCSTEENFRKGNAAENLKKAAELLKIAIVLNPSEYIRKESLIGQKKETDKQHHTIPQREIEIIARCIFPDILAFYESEEGQREFAQSGKRSR